MPPPLNIIIGSVFVSVGLLMVRLIRLPAPPEDAEPTNAAAILQTMVAGHPTAAKIWMVLILLAGIIGIIAGIDGLSNS